MGKLLEVREFDTITGNADFERDEKYKYLDTAAFHDLVEFIHEFSGDEENADALDFMRISYKRNVGDVVTIKNYVGLIQMKNGFQVQVLPKISFDSGEDTGNKETKRIFLKMLKSRKDFPSKIFKDASLKVERMNLYEIFMNMYLQEVRLLVKRGIQSAYVRQEDNLKFYKGKLLTSQHIKSNMAHKERFYASYDEFHPNRPENKLVKATLLKLQHLTTSAENSKEIRQLLTAFEMVQSSTNYTKDFSLVKIERNTKDYEMLMQWSKVFLLNQSFTTFSGKNTSRALLFPMESVYERYVAQQMGKVLRPAGWEVSSQDKGYYLFMEPRHQFALRPDIVCKRGDRTVIMDTKWKNLINSERANYGISQSDMYQMYAYSKKYQTSEIWLLYPLNDEMRGHSDIKFESGDGTTVRLHFVDVAHIEETLEELKDKLEVTES
ncbi:MAG: McrC family protein [Coprococcus sp.]|nr:McrC family protein [Coprococcus sp.]